ncbi:hypothetical protein ASF18_11225 [Methylobacterium sp. Leaf89]|nr:hypothetical protein ASF18_11225 [Methylobacterium sp. Leaf89]
MRSAATSLLTSFSKHQRMTFEYFSHDRSRTHRVTNFPSSPFFLLGTSAKEPPSIVTYWLNSFVPLPGLGILRSTSILLHASAYSVLL